jgi:hypothetical protein
LAPGKTDRQKITDGNRIALRMVKKAVQRGRSKRGGEAYSLRYVEPLSAARTKLADFFNILLVESGIVAGDKVADLCEEAEELTAIMVSSAKTVKTRK